MSLLDKHQSAKLPIRIELGSYRLEILLACYVHKLDSEKRTDGSMFTSI